MHARAVRLVCDKCAKPGRLAERIRPCKFGGARQGGKSPSKQFFFEKRTKKLLFSWRRAGRIGRAIQWSKSFLFLFFKKEILSVFLAALAQTL
jgi:hypothetical protein